jgi:hypothetical protein
MKSKLWDQLCGVFLYYYNCLFQALPLKFDAAINTEVTSNGDVKNGPLWKEKLKSDS